LPRAPRARIPCPRWTPSGAHIVCSVYKVLCAPTVPPRLGERGPKVAGWQ
jgi:hypothetical protein